LIAMSRAAAIAGAAIVWAVLLTGCDGSSPDGEGQRAGPGAELPERREAPNGAPNVVLIVTDDQTYEAMSALDRTRRLLGGGGSSFSRAFASFPLCCPSRVTMLTGQYAHNHGAIGNHPADDGGGYVNLREPERTLATWLWTGGYATAHIGKWANSPGHPTPPPGWDRWDHTFDKTTSYYGYRMGLRRATSRRYGYGEADYQTDAVTDEAVAFIDRGQARPFFLSVAYLAPHDGSGRDDAAGVRCGGVGTDGEPAKGEAQPPERYADAFSDAPLPQPPSFEEADVSDKPDFVALPEPAIAGRVALITRRYRCELASLLAVDDGVAAIVEALRKEEELTDTVIVFTSDNGAFHGEHRISGGKNLPYEEAIQVPLLIRGPGLEAGQRIASPVVNADLAPTILELTGVEPPASLARPVDGESLVPLLEGGPGATDRAILIEGRQSTSEDGFGYEVRSYQGVRTRRYMYVEHFRAGVDEFDQGAAVEIGAGELAAAELYDLERDPYELLSVVGAPAYARTEAALRSALDGLRQCAGSDCHEPAAVPDPAP
jgi:arylsulfatase A-like enzyme